MIVGIKTVDLNRVLRDLRRIYSSERNFDKEIFLFPRKKFNEEKGNRDIFAKPKRFIKAIMSYVVFISQNRAIKYNVAT